MTYSRRARLSAALLMTAGSAALLLATERFGFIEQAFAQADDEKKDRKDGKAGEKKRDRQPERRSPPQKQPPPKMERSGPPPQQKLRKDGPPPARDTRKAPGEDGPPRDMKKAAPDGKRFKQDGPPRDMKKAAPDGMRPSEPPRRDGAPERKTFDAAPKPQKDDFRRAPAAKGPAPDGTPPGLRKPYAGPGPKRFDEIQKGRRERVEDGGRRKVIQEPGNRFIVKQDNKTIIRRDESERFRRRPGAKSLRRADGSNETSYVRKDGSRIFTIVDGNGRLLRRYRRGRDGREFNIIDNRRFYRRLGVGIGLGIIALNLGMPRITIPRDRYIVDYEHASDDDLYETLMAPPVEDLDRAYALDEIRYNYELRARMRRIDLDTITFEFGAWEVPPDQYQQLERIAHIMLRVLERNSEAVFFIEGHTDAVGPDDDNLSLADRRASAVAEILSDQFGVPAENLVTQGYGEQYLKVDTQEPERLNRRVTILNITRLMAER